MMNEDGGKQFDTEKQMNETNSCNIVEEKLRSGHNTISAVGNSNSIPTH